MVIKKIVKHANKIKLIKLFYFKWLRSTDVSFFSTPGSSSSVMTIISQINGFLKNNIALFIGIITNIAI